MFFVVFTAGRNEKHPVVEAKRHLLIKPIKC